MYSLMIIGNAFTHSEDNSFRHHMFSSDFWGGMVWMWLFWLLVIIGIIILIIFLVNNTSSNNKPLDVLKERYAKGEIDKKEFEEKKKALK
ncbi:MAG: SHOCT domain-containing protein [Patescibacteria group bacterium]|nr:SHOCT domain-containing protein [Patescibacteria group bacterium]